MCVTTVLLFAWVSLQQVQLMRADGCLFSLREWWRLAAFLLPPRRLPSLLLPYLAYFGPRFHPSHEDPRPLIAHWSADYAPAAAQYERGRAG